MRLGALRALLTTLRANGVTDYIAPDGKGTLTLKLGGEVVAPVVRGKSKAEAPVSEAGRMVAQLQTKEAAETLKRLDVPVEIAAEILGGMA